MNILSEPRTKDRRAHPRIACSIECVIPETKKGRILNLSADGALVALAEPLQEKQTDVQLQFLLEDDSQTFVIPARIVREAVCLPQSMHIGLSFVHPEQQIKQRLYSFVLAKLLREAGLHRTSKSLKSEHIKTISESVNIAHVLHLELQPGTKGTLFQYEIAEQLRTIYLQKITDEEIVIQVVAKDSLWLAPSTKVHLFFTLGFAFLYFEAWVIKQQDNLIYLTFPKMLSRISRGADSHSMYVEIPLPYPIGRNLICEVLEVFDTGIAIKMDPHDTYFLPGTPIRELILQGVENRFKHHSQAQVANIIPVKAEEHTVEYLRVELDFTVQNPLIAKGIHPAYQYKKNSDSIFAKVKKLFGYFLSLRPPLPKNANSLKDIEIVRYVNRKHEEIVAIINTTPRSPNTRLHAPLIIIPPAHGKRKESTLSLALTLVENFIRHQQAVVVLRFDGIRNVGESYNDLECRESGREMAHFTLSQGVEDIQATLDYAYNNSIFLPTKVILVTPSIQGVVGRKAVFLEQGKRIHYWLGSTGVPWAQDIIKNASGGIDYVTLYANGHKIGERSILGQVIQGDQFCEDVLVSKLAFKQDAKQEIAQINIPITWILGRYDAWVDPDAIHEVFRTPALAPRQVYEVDCGHVPLQSDDALKLFELITQEIWQFLFRQKTTVSYPHRQEFLRIKSAEWGRLPKFSLPNKQDYWRNYLLGESDRNIRYDILNSTDEYLQFLDKQAELLEVNSSHRIADMACGTGNFSMRLLSHHVLQKNQKIDHLSLVDFVPEALAKVEAKITQLKKEYPSAMPEITSHCINLELSPLHIFKQFLTKGYHNYEGLENAIEGLSKYSIEMWKSNSHWRLHEILRGRILDPRDIEFLQQRFPVNEQEIILDMNRLSRFVQGKWEQSDLSREGEYGLQIGKSLRVKDIKLKHLSLDDKDKLEQLPFPDGNFDRIICSLGLSYIKNPIETLKEFYRCLSPGGILVASSMRPDVDMSRICQNLLRKLETGAEVVLPEGMSRAAFIDDLRHYLNHAAYLLRLEEEGYFSFFSGDELTDLLEQAGFRRVRNEDAFGDPPQACIVVGQRLA